MSSSSETAGTARAGGAERPELEALLRYELDPYFRDRARTTLEFLQLGPGDRLLDCGCGKGFFVSLVDRLHACDLVAIDPSYDALRIARDAERTTTLAQADATHLPFAAGRFTKILCSEVLEHIEDDARVLDELHRVLAPDGIVAVTVPNRAYPLLWDPINKVLESCGAGPIRNGAFAGMWTDHRRLYDIDELAERAERAGFEIEERRLLTRFCLPFTHNLLYGLGLRLLERGWLPERLRRGADRRFQISGRERPSALARLLGGITGTVDALNRRRPPQRVSIGVALRLRKREV